MCFNGYVIEPTQNCHINTALLAIVVRRYTHTTNHGKQSMIINRRKNIFWNASQRVQRWSPGLVSMMSWVSEAISPQPHPRNLQQVHHSTCVCDSVCCVFPYVSCGCVRACVCVYPCECVCVCIRVSACASMCVCVHTSARACVRVCVNPTARQSFRHRRPHWSRLF